MGTAKKTNADIERTDAMNATLKQLWAEGHSTAEIGRRMNISKNAVVGKVHRLGLPARPSPIKGVVTKPREEKPQSLYSCKTALPAAKEVPLAPLPDQPPPAKVLPFATVSPAAEVVRVSKPKECCWPIGEPGTANFRFCCGDLERGRPYCAEHVKLAYIKRRDGVCG